MYPYNKKLVSNAKALRKQMTPEERHLWYDFLKNLPVTVKRQKNIENYILDFYIASAKVAIEIDGRQHTLSENREEDAKRDAVLSVWGIKVLRFTNEDIHKRFFAVCENILSVLEIKHSELEI